MKKIAILAIIVIFGASLASCVSEHEEEDTLSSNNESELNSISTERFSIYYSQDKMTAIVECPYERRKFCVLADTISYLYNEGYVYVGTFQVGNTFSLEIEFIDYLIFRKEVGE